MSVVVNPLRATQISSSIVLMTSFCSLFKHPLEDSDVREKKRVKCLSLFRKHNCDYTRSSGEKPTLNSNKVERERERKKKLTTVKVIVLIFLTAPRSVEKPFRLLPRARQNNSKYFGVIKKLFSPLFCSLTHLEHFMLYVM